MKGETTHLSSIEDIIEGGKNYVQSKQQKICRFCQILLQNHDGLFKIGHYGGKPYICKSVSLKDPEDLYLLWTRPRRDLIQIKRKIEIQNKYILWGLPRFLLNTRIPHILHTFVKNTGTNV